MYEEIDIEPIQYRERLDTLQSQLPAILSDFKKYYILYNKENPEDDKNQYAQIFENIKQNLMQINADLFTLSNEVQQNTDEINKGMIILDELIRRERETNRQLKIKLGIVENKNNASMELISNYKEIYEKDYLRNWGLFFSIIAVAIAIKKTY